MQQENARPSERYEGLPHAILAAFEQTNAPSSRKGILRYLVLVATKRPKTYLALLRRCLDYQDPKLTADKKAFGVFLEELLVEALDEWVEPESNAHLVYPIWHEGEPR